MKQLTTEPEGTAPKLESTISHPPQGALAVIFYNSRADTGPGNAWVAIAQTYPVNLEGRYYEDTTAAGNGVLVYRTSGPRQHYERLASNQGREVLAKYDESTFLAQRMLDRARQAGADLNALPTLSEPEERLLLGAIQRAASRSGLMSP